LFDLSHPRESVANVFDGAGACDCWPFCGILCTQTIINFFNPLFRPWAAGKWTLSSILNRKGRQEVAARAT
jgi:hypothetical protein